MHRAMGNDVPFYALLRYESLEIFPLCLRFLSYNVDESKSTVTTV